MKRLSPAFFIVSACFACAVSAELAAVRQAGSFGTGEGELNGARDVSFSRSAAGLGRLMVTEAGNRRLSIFDDSLVFLHTLDLYEATVPGSAIQLPSGETVVFDCLLRRLVCYRRGRGKTEVSGFSPGCRLRNGGQGRILLTDPAGGAVTVFSPALKRLRTLDKAFGLFFKAPCDALPFPGGVAVLDRGNGRLVLAARSGAGILQAMRPELSEGLFLVKVPEGWLVFLERGGAIFFNDRLECRRMECGGKRFLSGVSLGEGRMVLVPADGDHLVEYRFSRGFP